MNFENSWKAAKIDYKQLTDTRKPDGKKRDARFGKHKSQIEGSLKAVDKLCIAFEKDIGKAAKTPKADLQPLRDQIAGCRTAVAAATKPMKDYDATLTEEMAQLSREEQEVLYRAQKVLKKVLQTIEAEMDAHLTKMVVALESLEARAAGGEPDPEARKREAQEKKLAVELARALAHVAKLKAALVKNISDVSVLASAFGSAELVCGYAGQETRMLAKVRNLRLPDNIDRAVDSLFARANRQQMAAALASPKEAALALKGLNEDLKEIADWSSSGCAF